MPEQWTGGTWKVETTPQPDGAADYVFDSVSCRSATVCTAVGTVNYGDGKALTLAERKSGSAWAIQTTPNGAGVGNDRLWGVSCPTTTSCFAVGDYVDKSDVELTLAEQWNGRAWSIKAAPEPAGTQIALVSVSCTSARACTAVGFYDNRSGKDVALAERWNGTAWKIETLPAPAGTDGYLLEGVSCASASACTAVGSWFTASSPEYPLAERWNGTSWKLQTVPRPGGSGGFQNVSCTAASTCTAIGYTFKSEEDLPFEESELPGPPALPGPGRC